MKPLHRPLAFLPLLLAACTVGDDEGSGSSGGSAGSAVVQFVFAEQTVGEGVVQALALLDLSEPVEQDVEVIFQTQAPSTGPAATEFVDYQLVTASPVVIPANTTSAGILIQVFDDGLGELDEGLAIRLTAASNASLGAVNVFTLTIEDDDALAVPESEPNSTPGQAQDLGPIAEGLAYEVSGMILPLPEIDYFQLTATTDTDVFMELTPVGAGGDVTLVVTDPMGVDLIPPVHAGPAMPVSLIYPAVTGEVFLAEVSNIGTGTAYTLKVVGLAPVAPLVAQRPGAWAARRVLVVDGEGEVVLLEETVEYRR